jgi:hypothetical protein
MLRAEDGAVTIGTRKQYKYSIIQFYIFYVLSTVHLDKILLNDQTDAQFFFSYMFIPILYMFRALMCSTSGKLIVSIQYLVYVTLCR